MKKNILVKIYSIITKKAKLHGTKSFTHVVYRFTTQKIEAENSKAPSPPPKGGEEGADNQSVIIFCLNRANLFLYARKM